MPELKFHWIQDSRNKAFVFGIPDHGGGVFQEDGSWYGNSVVSKHIVGFGPFKTMIGAQIEVEEDFVRTTFRSVTGRVE
jgi:hypothetical protein